MNPFSQFRPSQIQHREQDGEFFSGLQFTLFFLTFLVCIFLLGSL